VCRLLPPAIGQGKNAATGTGASRARNRHIEEMSAFIRRIPAFSRPGSLLLFATVACFGPESPARAFDLFATHEVTAQFATTGGKPMTNAEVRVFAPGDLQTPVETGRTDADGKFVFPADRDGMWSAEARTKTEVARVMIRVGGATQPQPSRVSPFIVIGGLIVLLALALWYRLLRKRNRRFP
jgi:hypothetical protein